jgi:hypothetical protein
VVSFILTAVGLLLLVISLAGVALGLYMAADKRTRRRGRLFAVLWVPALAASTGVLMRDIVTFTVGLLCFLVAGTVFVLQGDVPTEPPAGRKADWPEAQRKADSSTPKRPPKRTKPEARAG